MKKILTIAAACLALTACNEKFIASPVNDGFGYLDINLSTNDDIVVSTKAATAVDDATAKTYLITINNGSENKISQKKLGDFTAADYILPAGTYTVSAESITTNAAEENNGAVRLFGSKSDVTITKDNTTDVAIECSVANACVSAKTVGFNTWFNTGYTIKVKRGEREKTLTEDKTTGSEWSTENRVFYNIVEDNTLTWTINATNTASDAKEYTGTITLEAGKWYQLTFTASSNNGTISGITIKADATITAVPSSPSIDPFKTTTKPSAE